VRVGVRARVRVGVRLTPSDDRAPHARVQVGA
jgi:hypothetical protein